MHILPEHESRMVFVMIFSNLKSCVMQMGDKNGPATFQQLMNLAFVKEMGVFVHCYQDNIFIYSDTLEEHLEHLKIIFD